MHFSDQVNVSVWTLLTICFDRYQAIIHPFKSKQSKTGARWPERMFSLEKTTFQDRFFRLQQNSFSKLCPWEIDLEIGTFSKLVRYNSAVFIMITHSQNILNISGENKISCSVLICFEGGLFSLWYCLPSFSF